MIDKKRIAIVGAGIFGSTITLRLADKGFSCDCPAYVKCKHIKKIEAGIVGED